MMDMKWFEGSSLLVCGEV